MDNLGLLSEGSGALPFSRWALSAGKVPEFLEASFSPSVLWALSSKEGKSMLQEGPK